MSNKRLPYLNTLIVFLILVSLCGCNSDVKKFVKNKVISKHDSNDISEVAEFFDDSVKIDYGENEWTVKDESKSVSSGVPPKRKKRIFGKKRNMKKEDETNTVVRSQNIILADKNESEKRDLKPDNKESLSAGRTIVKKTNPVYTDNRKTLLSRNANLVYDASDKQHSKSASIEVKINELVKRMAMAVSGTEKLKVSIVEFPNFEGGTTDFTKFLYEELVTSFSSNPKFEVVDSLHTIIGKESEEIDAIVTGSIMNLPDSAKVNARLMLKKTGLILTAVSTALPKDKVMERLMGKKHEVLAAKTTRSSLYSQIDDLARQIVNSLQQGERYRMVLLEFTDLNGETNAFSKFLSQELVTRLFLADSKKIEVVDNNIISEFMKVHDISLGELAYPEFCKKLADSLGVNSMVKGIITDLGNSIKLNARIITTETGSIFGVAAVDIVKDEKLAKLLGEKPKARRKIETGKIEIKEGRKKVDSFLMDGAVFFKEDFSTFEEGLPLLEWGEGLVVKKDEDNKNFLTSDIDEFSVAAQEVQFPGEFSFEFEVKGNTKYWSSIRFKDVEGNEFQVSFRLFQNLLSITLPGPKQVKTEIDINKYSKIKIVRKNKLYELHTNGSLLIVGSYSKYKEFKSFEIHSAFSRFQFAGFLGNNLVES